MTQHRGDVTVTAAWDLLLRDELDSPWFRDLQGFVAEERRRHQVFPPEEAVFSAFRATAPADTTVVILGQDPYHGPGQATGMSFSVARGARIPPSLRNIFAERRDDLGLAAPDHGDLSAWAARGVLLLNTTLTVRAGRPGSHQGRGWERFTDAAISALARGSNDTGDAKNTGDAGHTGDAKNMVFVLWGESARAKRRLINDADPHGRHTVIESAHPSPLSARRGFFGSRPFSRANEALRAHGQEPVDWSLPV